jgi:hypothetical protein
MSVDIDYRPWPRQWLRRRRKKSRKSTENVETAALGFILPETNRARPGAPGWPKANKPNK